MVILNEAKPKYDHLDVLFDDLLTNIKFTNEVNIIIDLKEIFRKFYRPDLLSMIENGHITKTSVLAEEISSDIINTIGHYRNYFYKRGKYTNFFILYSSEKCQDILNIYPDYKKEYYEKYFNETDVRRTIIFNSYKAISKICKYIPDVAFIETSKYDEFVYAKYIVSKANDNEITLILSNSDIFTQLLKDNVFMLTLKGINSELVTNENVFNYLFSSEEEFKFGAGVLSTLFSLAGFKRYSIQGISNVGLIRANKIIEHLYENNKINIYDSIAVPIEFSKLDKKDKFEKILIDHKDEIVKNYNLIRLDELLIKNKTMLDLDLIPSTGNPMMLKEINEKIFTMFPLQMDMLLKGEKL